MWHAAQTFKGYTEYCQTVNTVYLLMHTVPRYVPGIRFRLGPMKYGLWEPQAQPMG